MTFLDFFAGIGGFRLGMEQAGHECLGHCEIDKFAHKSYMAMHDVKEGEWYANDICGVRPEELPEADVWCGGFPCQAFSVAGKRRGFEDMRGTLIFEIFRLAAERKPDIILLENVSGLLNHDEGNTFRTILMGFWELGYDVEWEVLNSKRWVPQNRERIFIVGYLGGSRGRKVFPIRQGSGKADELSGPVANTLTTRTTADTNGTYIVENQQPTQENSLNMIGMLEGAEFEGRHESARRVYGIDGIGPCLNTNGGGGLQTKIAVPAVLTPKRTEYGKNIRKAYESGEIDESRHNMTQLEPRTDGIANTLSTVQKDNLLAVPVLTPERAEKRQNGRRFKENGEDMFTLTAQDRHGVMINPSLNTDGTVTAIDAHYYKGHGIRSNKMRALAVDGTRIRRLTPLECFRLQGFPDELFYKAQKVNSDSQLYKQAGNSVTVNVIYEIGKRLKEVERSAKNE